MTKRLINIFLVIAFYAVKANAQEDVTRYFLTDYSFDENFNYTSGQSNAVTQEICNIPGWTQGFSHDYTITGIYEFGFSGTFNGAKIPSKGYNGETGGGLALSTGWSCDFPYTQTVILPAGTYTINVPTYNGCSVTGGTSLLAWIPETGDEVSSTLTSYTANSWTLDKITFTLSETTKGKIQIGFKAAAGGSVNSAKIVIDYVQIMGQDMSAISETNPLDNTFRIVNPSFEYGSDIGWANELFAWQSNTAFTLKEGTYYMERWRSAGTGIGNASVMQTISLPNGKYKFTASAQNLDQNNTSRKCTGANLVAIENSTPIYTAADYSVTFNSIAGNAAIGYLAEDAQGNWISFDNCRLYRIGNLSVADEITELNSLATNAENYLTQGISQDVINSLAEAITAAKSLTSSATETQIRQAASNLIRLTQLASSLTNATSDTAPQVTSTSHYVITGATEALMRAEFEGEGIVEKGICWSTSHNPTILDERTSQYYSLNGNIYHLTELKPATVYYLRPYAYGKTNVAYGDEVKIVTHPKGSCTGTWNEGADTDAANTRCRNAIQQTINYLNEWTAIKSFNLSGTYGSSTPTADCSYGGSMRIGPSESYQAIGTVLHESGHGVGVGTEARWSNTNVHNWKWYGREANKVYSFLENKEANPYSSDFCMVGDGTHGWGSSATYDWFVNGADKDTHTALQYIGGSALYYGLFIDGLNPTTSYKNGIAGYTYNFDDETKYYLMCKDASCGLGTGLLYMNGSTAKWQKVADFTQVSDNAAWYLEYDPQACKYKFRNASTNGYLTSGGNTDFQLMPDRTDISIGDDPNDYTTHGYWLTWYNSENKAFAASSDGSTSAATFDYADSATAQQWIILTEDELQLIQTASEKGESEWNDVSSLVTNYNFDITSDYHNSDLSNGASSHINPTGWTTTNTSTLGASAVMAIGSSYTLNGQAVPGTNAEGNATGGALGMSQGWNTESQYSQTVTLPAGTYHFCYDIMNMANTSSFTNLCGYQIGSGDIVYDQSISSLAVGSWANQAMHSFTLTEPAAVTFYLGFKAANTTSTTNPYLYYDRIYLYKYVLPGDIDDNNMVNIVDLAKLISILNGATSSSAADVNKDGKVNTDDITSLKKIILNK